MELLACDLPGIPKFRSGKVREVFDLGANLLLVATDRISAFDCILPNAIPHKGEVLNQISAFWFDKLDFIPNHVVTAHFRLFPADLKPFESQLAGRSMIVKKAAPLPVECVARGYLAGSGWNEYREKGSVCGNPLPKGLRQSYRLPETIFTSAINPYSGHDENIIWR
jgi:phosphoribosylaminoimidazole-succinocarboxamide synthase